MKKIFIMMFALVIVFSLAACGDKSSTPDSDTQIENRADNEAETNTQANIDDADDTDNIKTEDTTSNDIDSDFRAMMDSYENFVDEYVSFCKPYEASDNALSMVSDYMEMMSKYAEWAETIATIDEESLSDSDCLYYSEVMLRCSAKLMTVAE